MLCYISVFNNDFEIIFPASQNPTPKTLKREADMREAVWRWGFDKSVEVKLILAAFERLLNGNSKARLKDVLYEYDTNYVRNLCRQSFSFGLA
jgi:hypothetical protein